MNFSFLKKSNIQRKKKTQNVHHLASNVKIELNMICELSDRTNRDAGKKNPL